MPTPPDYKVKSYSHFAAHCSVTAKAQDKFTRYQNVERYRRLLKTATGEERRNYLRVGFESHEARAIRRTSSVTDAA